MYIYIYIIETAIAYCNDLYCTKVLKITNHHHQYYSNGEQILEVMQHRHLLNNVDMLNFFQTIDLYMMDEIYVHRHMVIVELVR